MSFSYGAVSITVAAVSLCFSLFVILTWLLFSQLRYKLFMQIIVYISIGDILGNFPYVFPFHASEGNWWCTLSGLLNFGGYPMEWMWTTTLIYLLYRLSVVGHIPKHFGVFHAINWGIPIVFAVCSLAFGPFRRSSNDYEVCVVPIRHAPIIYHFVTYYGIFYLCVVTICVLYVRLRYFMYENPPSTKPRQRAFLVTLSAAQWYGFILIIFWLPHNISEVIPTVYSGPVYNILVLWKILHGVATALVFFSQSKEARRLWWIFFRRRYVSCLRFCCRCCINRNPMALSHQDDNKSSSNFHNIIHSTYDNQLAWMRRTESDEAERIGRLSSHCYVPGGEIEAEDLFDANVTLVVSDSQDLMTPDMSREGSEIVMPPINHSSSTVA